MHSAEHGIELFEEGYFKNGKQNQFGRIFKMEKSMQKRYYTDFQTYVGWWANTGKGLGIAHTDGNMLYGEFKEDAGFPNDGRSFASPSTSEMEHETIDTLYYRTSGW